MDRTTPDAMTFRESLDKRLGTYPSPSLPSLGTQQGFATVAAAAFHAGADEPPTAYDTLASACTRMELAVEIEEHIWRLLDNWEGIPSTKPPGEAQQAPSNTVRGIAVDLFDRAEKVNQRLVGLQDRLRYLMERTGPL